MMETDSDDPIVEGASPSRPSRPHGVSCASPHVDASDSRSSARLQSRRLARIVDDDGPLQIVAILGSEGLVGAWAHRRFLQPDAPLAVMVRTNRKAVGLPDITLPPPPSNEEADRAAYLVGFGLWCAWSFLDAPEEFDATSIKHQLMRAISGSGQHGSGDAGFLAYLALAGAALDDPIALTPAAPADLESRDFAQYIIGLVGDRPLRLYNTGGAGDSPPQVGSMPMSELVDRWRQEYEVDLPRCAPKGWLVWLPVAEILARGAWLGDIVPLRPRDRKRRRLDPRWPPRSAELLYLEKRSSNGDAPRGEPRPDPHSLCTEEEVFSTSSKWGSRVRQFHPLHIANAVRASADLKQVGKLRRSTTNHLRLAFPTRHRQVATELEEKGFKVPSRTTLQRCRVRLDVVSMILCQRHPYLSVVSRTLSFDSSPQGGHELFASVVLTVARGPDGQPVAGRRHSQPFTHMGHAHTGVVYKTMNLIHKAALDVGFDVNVVETFFREVRVCVTDCGAEFSVADMPNYVREFLHRQHVQVQEFDDDRGYLMPNAIRWPGWSHSHDWCLRRCLTERAWWVEYLDAARALCWFLNQDSYRDVLVANLRAKAGCAGTEVAWDPKAAETFHANFAHWRFGTMATVSRQLKKAMPWFTAGFKAENYALKDKGKLMKVAKLASSSEFIKQNTIVEFVSTRNEELRKWGQGCPCHQAECMAAAKKGTVFECHRKGMLTAQARRHLEVTTLKWSSEVIAMRTTAEIDIETMFQLQATMRSLVAATKLRFRYASHLPWLLCQARDREVATECIAQYRRQLEAFDNRRPGAVAPHRVSIKFCGSGSRLQEAFHNYAQGGPMTEILHEELQGYEYGVIDESWAEGEHRNATHQRKRAKGSKFAWWAASARLEENLQAVDESIARDGGTELVSAWGGWKSLLQTSRKKRFRMTPTRISTRLFLARIYRLRDVGLEDWLHIDGPIKESAVAITAPAARNEKVKQSMIKDWAMCVFMKGGRYALPTVMDATLAGLGFSQGAGCPPNIAPGVAPVVVSGHRAKSCMCFQVLEDRPASLKLAFDSCAGLAVPLYIQWYQPWGLTDYDPREPPIFMSVWPDGEPVYVDGTTLAPFFEMRRNLLVWTTTAMSDIEGCVDWLQPIKFQHQDYGSNFKSYPLYETMALLSAAGWTPGARTDPHMPNAMNAKVYDVPTNCVALKGYYQCLKVLDKLFSEGLPSLHTRQTVVYYDLCLRSKNKSLVLPGRAAKAYQLELENAPALEERPWVVVDAIADVASAPAIDDGSSDAFVEQASDAGGGQVGGEANEVGPRDGGHPHHAHNAAPAVRIEGQEVLAAWSDSESIREVASASSSSSSSDSSTSSSDDDDGRADDDHAGAGAAASGEPLPRPDFPEFICGMRLRLESVVPTGRPPYQRLVIGCPLAGSRHMHAKPCGTSRKLGGHCTSRFGVIEAVGFLGVWAWAAETFPSRRRHMAWKPSPAAVEEFLRDRAML